MRFSLILPTYNRCGILGNALRSALNQTFDDYEVVVSNNGSTDDTEKVVKSFDDPRIRYIKRDDTLCMSDHWDWILDQIESDWVLFLADDDAVLSYCLEYLDQAIDAHPDIDLFSYRVVHYFYGGRLDGMKNVLVAPEKPVNSIRILDSQKQLVNNFQAFRLRNPTFPTACISRSFLKKIRAKYGCNFFMWAPDISSGFVHLANSQKFARILTPLAVSGKGVYSYGSGGRQNPDRLRDYLNQLPEFKGSFHYSPYPDLILVNNTILDTILKVKHELLSEELDGIEMSKEAIGASLMKDLRTYLGHGLTEYQEYADRIQKEMLGGKTESGIIPLLRKITPKPLLPLGRRLLHGRSIKGAKPGKVRVSGADAPMPFDGIMGAAECYEKHYGPFAGGKPLSLQREAE